MLKKLLKEEQRTKNFKVTEEEYEAMQKKADEYTNGNMSNWLRYAGTMHVPDKSELVERKKK